MILEHSVLSVPLVFRYHSAVKDASARPEVRNAKDAIDAYKNITDAVNAAEAAANEAKDAADNALNVSHGHGSLLENDGAARSSWIQ